MTNAEDDDAIERRIGEQIKQRRIEVGMTQEDLAYAIGVRAPQLQKYESGDNRVAASRLRRIARALGVPPSYFLNDDMTMTAPSPFNVFISTPLGRVIIEAVMVLNDDQKRVVLDLARSLHRR